MKISLEDPTFLTILLITVILFAIGLIAFAVFLVLKSRKKDKEAGPEAGKPEERARWLPTTVPGMSDSFRKAMKRLRERLPEWGYRYKVPWYVLVGETGSGKSTIAEVISSKSADSVETDATGYAPRWLLLDQAVLIDLPGRSFLSPEEQRTVQTPQSAPLLDHKMRDLDLSPDRTAWRSFLRLAARFRPRQPLNGIILSIAATELLAASEDAEHPHRLARIAGLSQRLDDVQHLLGLSLPVYVLVTKCDAVTGFSSYSRSLFEEAVTSRAASNGNSTAELSDNLFGWSNPYLLDSTFTPAWVDEAFDATIEVLLRRQLEMLAESKTAAAADGVFLFPFELQHLRAPLRLLLDRVFRTTAYHSSHLLRGIYFCGREAPDPSLPEPAASPAASNPFRQGQLEKASKSLLYVRHLFEFRVFPERYLAIPVARGYFSTNRSVVAAQIAACALFLLLGVCSLRAWQRIGSLQRDRIQPVLDSLATSLDNVAVSSGASLTPAVNVFNALGAPHQDEYYSLALPVSYLDLSGLHRDLSETLERSFEVVILRSCKFSLESRISSLINSGPTETPQTIQAASTYPPGNYWSFDPAYGALDRYLSDVRALHRNIQLYQLISMSGSGSFTQLNELLQYLHAPTFLDIGRFAHDANYQRLVLNATWQPLEIPPDFDAETAAATRQRITRFYSSWFDSNPLVAEVGLLSGADGLQSLSSAVAPPSNQQLRSIVSRAESMESQLHGGTYDWLALDFNREEYPALGPELDQMPFADSQFTNDVTREGSQRLAALRAVLETTPVVLNLQDGKTRLAGSVRTLASVLDALLGYELMGDAYENPSAGGACQLVPAGTVWSSNNLTEALQLAAMRSKVESELLPGLPGEYLGSIQALVDRRTVTALSSLLQSAAVPNPNQGDKQAALQAELQNLTQSVDKLKQIEDSLTGLRATAEASCLNRALTRQASSLLAQINQQLPALYGHAAATGNGGNELPVSLWLYGVPSADDLQAYLAAEHQQIEALSAQATPLVQLLRAAGGHSDVLSRWHNISQDVTSFQEQKPGNPIQALESFISTDLDKITPEANCKAMSPGHSLDVFLNVRAQLSRVAVEHCHQVAVARFNRIAADFDQRLAGRFPFSQLLDTRSGAEADPADISEFYQKADSAGPGLATVLPGVVQNPDEIAAFLQAMNMARPLVTGTPKDLAPALGLSVRFRTNRSRETFGNRIAQWRLQIGQQVLDSPPEPGDGPPPIWHLGDPITLSVRYANNSPEVPASSNPSPAASVQGAMVTYRYADTWSLFAMLRDHLPTSTDPPDQYVLTIPNVSASPSGSGAKPQDTVVYIQVDLLPIGAKPGGQTLPVPSFPYQAPMAAIKPTSGVSQ